MSTAPPLEVKVVFDASARRGQRGITAKPKKAARRGGAIGLICFGLLQLLVAGGFCYATWWPVEEFIVVDGALHTPIPDLNLDLAAQEMFGGLVSNRPGMPPGEVTKAEVVHADPSAFSPETTQKVIWISAGAWMVAATLSCCLLALAGGCAWGRVFSRSLKFLFVLLTLAGAGWLGWMVWQLWLEHGTNVTPQMLRDEISTLVVVFVLVGLTWGGSVRGVSRTAAVLVILSSLLAVAGLVLWKMCGALEGTLASYPTMAGIFVAHAFWGFIAWRWARRYVK